MQNNKFQSLAPTDKERGDDLVINGITCRTYDVGGHYAMRRVWKLRHCSMHWLWTSICCPIRDHCVGVDGIIFLVDAAEPQRFHEVKKELCILLSANELKEVPFLVLGNKIDKKEAVKEYELREELGISRTTGKHLGKKADDVRPLEVFMCSVKMKSGFADGLKWLSSLIWAHFIEPMDWMFIRSFFRSQLWLAT